MPMKTGLLLGVASLTLASLSSIAQVEKTKKTTYHVGIKAGYQLSSYIGVPDNARYLPGLSGGIALEQRFNSRLALAYEVFYSPQGSTFLQTENRDGFTYDYKRIRRYNYLAVPIVLRWKLSRFPATFELGPQVSRFLSLRIKAKPSYLGGNPIVADPGLKNTDVGAVAGIGYRLGEHVLLNLRYTRSIPKIYKDYYGPDPSDPSQMISVPGSRLYNQVFSFNAYFFL